MFSGMNVMNEMMRKAQIESMKRGVELQSKAAEITRRKIEAMNDARKASQNYLACKIKEERAKERPDKEMIDALIDMRRSDSALRVSEIEQIELSHAMELENLDRLKETLDEMENPNQVLEVNPKLGLLS